MNTTTEQPEVLFGSAAQVAMRDELAQQLAAETLRADRAGLPAAEHALFDAVRAEILLDESPDLRVVRLRTRQLIAAVQARDAVIQRMRQVLAETSYVRPQRFSLDDDPAARQER